MDWRRDIYMGLCAVLSELANTCQSVGVSMSNWQCGTPCGKYILCCGKYFCKCICKLCRSGRYG